MQRAAAAGGVAQGARPGLPSDVDMVDRSVHLSGSVVLAGEHEETPFSLTSDVSDRLELPFVDESGDPAILTLTRDEPMAEMRLELGNGRMLDGVDLREEDEDLLAFLAVRNLLASARAVLP